MIFSHLNLKENCLFLFVHSSYIKIHLKNPKLTSISEGSSASNTYHLAYCFSLRKPRFSEVFSSLISGAIHRKLNINLVFFLSLIYNLLIKLSWWIILKHQEDELLTSYHPYQL
jgi:hypothetical protein